MNFFNKIKNYFYQKSIEKTAAILANVSREMINLSEAQSIGILLDATKANDVITVTQFSDKLKAMGKEVSILAYTNTNDKENTDPKFFNNTNINWTNIPFGEKINQFQTKKFDILISALTVENLALEYLAATSKAKFRVGLFSKNKTNFYELMINTKKNQQLDYLLQQIFHFLNVINKK